MRPPRWSRAVLLVGAVLLALCPPATRPPSSPPAPTGATPAPPRPKIDRLRTPLAFEPNTGRWDRGIDYVARGAGYGLALSGGDARLCLRHGDRSAQVTMRLEGAERRRPRAEQALAGKVSYFIGQDRRQWRSGVPTYGQVRYRGVYDGIDLVYYGNQGQLEYDFRVRPHIDPQRIALSFAGAESLRIDGDGGLAIGAGGGGVRFHPPVAYQESRLGRQPVEA